MRGRIVDERGKLIHVDFHRVGRAARGAGADGNLAVVGVGQIERNRRCAGEIDAQRLHLGNFAGLRAHRQNGLYIGNRPGVDAVAIIPAASILQIANAQDVAAVGRHVEDGGRVVAMDVHLQRQFVPGFVVNRQEWIERRTIAGSVNVKDKLLPFCRGESKAVDIPGRIDFAGQRDGKDDVLRLLGRIVRLLLLKLRILPDRCVKRRGNTGRTDEPKLATAQGRIGVGGNMKMKMIRIRLGAFVRLDQFHLQSARVRNRDGRDGGQMLAVKRDVRGLAALDEKLRRAADERRGLGECACGENDNAERGSRERGAEQAARSR